MYQTIPFCDKVSGLAVLLSAALLFSALAEMKSAGTLYVDIDVKDLAALQDGQPVEKWQNHGDDAVNEFSQLGSAAPVYSEDIGGHAAVTFDGVEDRMETYDVFAPAAILDNGSWTVEAWVYNPTIAEEEAVFSWAPRDVGVNATAQINYGSNPNYGAVTHFGDGDMGFDGDAPKEGSWHYLVVTYDGLVERVYVDGQLNATESKDLKLASPPQQFMILGAAWDPQKSAVFGHFSGSIARLRLEGEALSASEVLHNFNADAQSFGLTPIKESEEKDSSTQTSP